MNSLHSGCLVIPPDYQARPFRAEEGRWQSTYCVEHAASGLLSCLEQYLSLSSSYLAPGEEESHRKCPSEGVAAL